MRPDRVLGHRAVAPSIVVARGVSRLCIAGHAHDPTDIWSLARGGQIYENWMSVMERLALFLSRGQIDMDRYIDRETKIARGSPRHGAATEDRRAGV